MFRSEKGQILKNHKIKIEPVKYNSTQEEVQVLTREVFQDVPVDRRYMSNDDAENEGTLSHSKDVLM